MRRHAVAVHVWRDRNGVPVRRILRGGPGCGVRVSSPERVGGSDSSAERDVRKRKVSRIISDPGRVVLGAVLDSGN